MGLEDAVRRRTERDAQAAGAKRQAKAEQDAHEAAYIAAVTQLDPLMQRFMAVVLPKFGQYSEQFAREHRQVCWRAPRPAGVSWWNDDWRREISSTHKVTGSVSVRLRDGKCVEVETRLSGVLGNCTMWLTVVPAERIWYVNLHVPSGSDDICSDYYMAAVILSNEALLSSCDSSKRYEVSHGDYKSMVSAWYSTELCRAAQRTFEAVEDVMAECLDALGVPYSSVTAPVAAVPTAWATRATVGTPQASAAPARLSTKERTDNWIIGTVIVLLAVSGIFALRGSSLAGWLFVISLFGGLTLLALRHDKQ